MLRKIDRIRIKTQIENKHMMVLTLIISNAIGLSSGTKKCLLETNAFISLCIRMTLFKKALCQDALYL